MNNFYKHIFRSSRLQMFFKIRALKNFAIFRIKKRLTPTQVFSCKKQPHDVNILIDFFTEHLSLATFVLCRCSSKQTLLKVLETSQEALELESLFKTCRLKACNFIKNRLQRRCFSVKFVKFLRTPFLQNLPGDCFFTSYFCIFLKKVIKQQFRNLVMMY